MRLPILLILCLTSLVSGYVGWRWQRPLDFVAPAPTVDRSVPANRFSLNERRSVGPSTVRPSTPSPAAFDEEGPESLSGDDAVTGLPQTRLAPGQVVRVGSPNGMWLGQVLAEDDAQLALMSPQGSLHFIPWRSARQLEPTSQSWSPWSTATYAEKLAEEFGAGFQVRGSNHFLVVQPTSVTRDWPRVMQQFYGNVQTYCAARQIQMNDPRFPLVAIVLPNRSAMLEYARRQAESVQPNFRAYYGLHSNRVVMVDAPPDRTEAEDSTRDWNEQLDMPTVYHETFHQVAFNTGLHRRTLPPPLWVSEGMATAFETPGMADHRRSRTVQDRLHRSQAQLFRDFARRPEFTRNLTALLANDDLFRESPTEAYALAWAVAFYWMEQSPAAFSNYLARLGRGPAFRPSTPAQRLSDFQSLSQCSLPEFQQRLIQYFDRLQ